MGFCFSSDRFIGWFYIAKGFWGVTFKVMKLMGIVLSRIWRK